MTIIFKILGIIPQFCRNDDHTWEFSRLECLFSYSDGRSRTGVYCAANACIEQVIQYGEVDVFTAVKTVRRHRPQMIENMVSVNKIIFINIISIA